MDEKVLILDDDSSLFEMGAITMLKYLEGERKESYLNYVKENTPEAWEDFKLHFPQLLKEWGIEI